MRLALCQYVLAKLEVRIRLAKLHRDDVLSLLPWLAGREKVMRQPAQCRGHSGWARQLGRVSVEAGRGVVREQASTST